MVPPGHVAVFRLAYAFPADVRARLYLAPNFDARELDEDPFGTSASTLLSGRGEETRLLVLGAGGDEPYAQELLLQSVRISAELEAAPGAPRNNTFFICDAPVNVLFANAPQSDGRRARALAPAPAPKPDPARGVVARRPGAAPVSSTPPGFTDDLDAALAKAKAGGKRVMVCFSGSDWCVWCQKLAREVLAQPAFVADAAKDFELVFVDAPENKAVLSARARRENPKLIEKYAIKGFPTVLILDADGRKLGETGYRAGGPAAYAAHLRALVSGGATPAPGR